MSTFLEELNRFRPRLMADARESVENGNSKGRCFHPEAASFADLQSESVDYAIMENTFRAAMVPADMAWSDLAPGFLLSEFRTSLLLSTGRRPDYEGGQRTSRRISISSRQSVTCW